MKNSLAAAALVCAGLLSQGCLMHRSLRTVIHPMDRSVTLLSTFDIYGFIWPVVAKNQFWKCTEAPGAVTCVKVCDSRTSDLTCPTATAVGGAVYTNIQ